ncbi:MAG: chemotaxis protein CheW [Firmicutes bacterium]|nr:chemotaxis protein CheW [Bacillota bacterium]
MLNVGIKYDIFRVKGGSVASDMVELVVFLLSGELYGISIAQVREIIPFQAVTSVPRTPPYVLGVTNLRGRVIPVIDLRVRIGLPSGRLDQGQKIAVVELDGQTTVGMVVDGVSEVLQIPQDSVEPTPPTLTDIEARYIAGVAKQEGNMIILLDMPKVLARRP